MIYILSGPIGIFLVFRVILPIIWCFNFLAKETSDHKYYYLVLFHLLYLIVEGLLCIILIIQVNKLIKMYNKIKYNRENGQIAKITSFTLLSIVIFLIFNYNSLPIYLEGGSDAIVFLDEQYKIRAWFFFSFLWINLILLTFAYAYETRKKRKIIYAILILAISTLPGKKSAVITALSNMLFLNYVFQPHRFSLSDLLKIVILFIIGISFAIFIYLNTLSYYNADVEFSTYLDLVFMFFNLLYSSSTVYLEDFIISDGLSLADEYSKSLGTYGPFVYILNPFLKFFFGTGIEKAIGPYLSYHLYNDPIPHGVNPTLFFEYIFVFGSETASIFAFFHMIFILYFINFLLRKMIKNKRNMFLSATFYSLILLSFFFLADALNAIKRLPFVLIPLLYFFIIKFLSSFHKVEIVILQEK